jgi:hypothetical protein
MKTIAVSFGGLSEKTLRVGLLREQEKKPREIHFRKPHLAECAFKKAISLFHKSILIV